jgi:hypothetical protein
MTSIFLTIDTELEPGAHKRGVSPEDNFSRSILGRTTDGDRGISYQAERLRAYGVKAAFFVEALSAQVVGLDVLKRTIDPILSHGHEVQLHIHTEWLEWFTFDPVEGHRGWCIADFHEDDQYRLLELGMETLAKAGAPTPTAFRAGNYGGDNATLRALCKLGLLYDTSYNLPYLPHPCRISAPQTLFDAVPLEGVVEMPVACFEDFPGHYRPAQICANSISELRLVIANSIKNQRRTAIIVSHSFELMNRKRGRENKLLVHRFEALCDRLADCRDTARASGFADVDPATFTIPPTAVPPLRSHAGRTAWRMVEQAVGSILYE